MNNEMKSKIKIWVRKNFIGTTLMAIILFISAGRLNWIEGWVYIALSYFGLLVNLIVLASKNPEVLAVRSEITQKDTKTWDKLFTSLYGPMLLVIMAVSGLDAGRNNWSSVPGSFRNISIAVFIIAWGIMLWAMASNKFFESSVRIQEDRGQETVSSGPYALVRHPGYLGILLFLLATPIMLGSWWGLIPSLLLIMGFFLRTALEDKTLLDELPSYSDYVKKVRYRLIPGIW